MTMVVPRGHYSFEIATRCALAMTRPAITLMEKKTLTSELQSFQGQGSFSLSVFYYNAVNRGASRKAGF